MLVYLKQRIDQENLSNITPVLGTSTSVSLPNESVDMMLLVEFRAEDESVPIKTIHKMSEAQAVKELKAVGFRLEKNIKNLPWQHCMIFVKE